MALDEIGDALESIRAGRPVVVVDDEERENEGDLVFAAEKATPELVAFMVRHCSGIVCVPMEPERLDSLQLPLMAPSNSDPMGTAFTISVDARAGTTTGISAADRAATIRALVRPETRPSDLHRPGHVFPLRYTPGGVLRRPGHTEAAVDLARLAGLYPAGVLCEVVGEDGAMARLPELVDFARHHRLPIISIADLIAHRRNGASAGRDPRNHPEGESVDDDGPLAGERERPNVRRLEARSGHPGSLVAAAGGGALAGAGDTADHLASPRPPEGDVG